MKKRIFATVALLATMALVGCGGKKECEKHKWGTWEVTTENSCTADGVETRKCSVCGKKEERVLAAAHVFDDNGWTETTPATCAAPGVETRTCTRCHNASETRPIAKLDHNWESQGNSADVDGAAATEQFKCSQGDHYALRWSAQSLDEAATLEACGLPSVDQNIYAEINNSGSHSGSIRLKKAENDGGEEKLGTHVVYKINVAAAVTNAELSFQIDPKSGYTVKVFDYVDGDQQQGYIKKQDGSLELTTKRYGLRVNGADVTLGEDQYDAIDGGSKLWFNWNVKVNLNAGINTIDVYCLGGYRAYIYNFQLEGLTAAQLPAKAVA